MLGYGVWENLEIPALIKNDLHTGIRFTGIQFRNHGNVAPLFGAKVSVVCEGVSRKDVEYAIMNLDKY